MNKKRKHHYIPKFILKQFSTKNQICVYRFKQNIVINNSTTDAFAINELNTLIDKDGNTHNNLIEDTFDQLVETKAAVSIQKIIDDLAKENPSGNDFSTEDFINVLRFCILGNLRVPFSLEKIHHALKVSLFSTLMFKHFWNHNNFEIPIDDFEIPKGFLYSFIMDFDSATKLIADLKLTIYTHKIENEYFILPDQYVIIISPNNCKFSDKELKMYFPISSKIVLCFERIDRSFNKGFCYIDKQQVEEFNLFFANNSYESFGCENNAYLNGFIKRNKSKIVPLSRYNPYSDFNKEKEQIKIEIIKASILCKNQNSVKTAINRFNEFKIYNEEEFKNLEKEMNPTVKINTRYLEL